MFIMFQTCQIQTIASQYLPFKTIKYERAGPFADIVDFDSISGI